MKRYLLVDLMGDYKKTLSLDELKEETIDIIKDDMLSNCGEYEIVRDCADSLVCFAKGEMTIKDIKEQLESYSYKVIDLLEIRYDLGDIEQYFQKDTDCNVFNVAIDRINKELDEVE